MKLERLFPRVTFVEILVLIFQHLSQSIFPLLGILALRMLPKFVFPRKE